MIDIDSFYKRYMFHATNKADAEFNQIIREIKKTEAIPKEQYEARLKAEKIAMLEELKKEIIELPFPQREPEYMQGYSDCQMNILEYVILEKINELKGVEDGKDN